MSKTSAQRRKWIRDHYRLETTEDGRSRAVSSGSAIHSQTRRSANRISRRWRCHPSRLSVRFHDRVVVA